MSLHVGLSCCMCNDRKTCRSYMNRRAYHITMSYRYGLCCGINVVVNCRFKSKCSNTVIVGVGVISTVTSVRAFNSDRLKCKVHSAGCLRLICIVMAGLGCL